MKKKNRPNNALVPVMHGQAFASFLNEGLALSSELAAHRAFLEERGLAADFLAWRQKG